jgi:hypothetical protein
MRPLDGVFIGTAIVGAMCIGMSIGAIAAMPKPYNVEKIEHCREIVATIEGLPAAERARIERIRAETPALETEWRVVKAIAAVVPAEDEQ